MIIPVRCFSCGGVIAHKWEDFKQLLADGKTDAEALDEVGLKRYCCRRMYVGHLDLIEEVAPFSACLLYTSPSPRDKRQSRMPSSA